MSCLIWNGYNIEFENGVKIEVGPYGENLENVRISKEHPKTITVWVCGGTANVFGYESSLLAYLNMLRFTKKLELSTTPLDARLSNEIVNLPDGIYDGYRAAYLIKLGNGCKIKTIIGIKCSGRHPVRIKVKIHNCIAYAV